MGNSGQLDQPIFRQLGVLLFRPKRQSSIPRKPNITRTNAMSLHDHGYDLIQTDIPDYSLNALRDSLFSEICAGERCLLDPPLVREIAIQLKTKLIEAGHLCEKAVAIQAIAFNKTAATNWKVAWHQDLMFPFFEPVSTAGYDLPCRKNGVDYARPPSSVLSQLLAVRLHLDDCEESSGPLRISPGTHRAGILRSAEIAAQVARHGDFTCVARKGQALLMRPLTLHSSSQATAPKNRRVLHLVYHSGDPMPELWHRSV